MPVRPYRLLGQSLLAAAQRVIDAALDGWCADWGVARSELSLACHRGWDDSAGRAPIQVWRGRAQQGDAVVWLGASAELAQSLQHSLFAPDRSYAHAPTESAPLAAETAEAALEALLSALLSALMPGVALSTGAAPPAEVYAVASGALLATVGLGRHRCTCVLNLEALTALAEQARLRGLAPGAPRAALRPLDYRAVLAQVPVTVPVGIGQVQLGLGTLMSLGVGDVIRLDSAADHPLAVRGPGGKPLFAGYLGLADQHVALEVVRQKP